VAIAFALLFSCADEGDEMGNLQGRSGRVSIATSTTPSTRTTRAPQVLCTYQSNHDAKALTLLLTAQLTALPNNPNFPLAFFLPSNLGGEEYTSMVVGRTGILVIEYGSGAARNYIFADIRPGAYAIPPCDFAQVSVLAFHPHASGGDPLPALDVAGTLLEGQHKQAARFTSSLVATVQPATHFGAITPPNARWVDIEGGNVESPLGTVAQAKVRFMEESTLATGYGAGRYIVRDEAAGKYPDPMPVELAGANGFRVWNDGAAAAVITVKFYLEL
jgi:hypothetical protein